MGDIRFRVGIFNYKGPRSTSTSAEFAGAEFAGVFCLLIALWRYLETGVVPTATVLKA